MNLRAMEEKLLRFLKERAGNIVSRDELIRHVWGFHPLTQTRTVDQTISQLRRKLTGEERIETSPGMGYRYVNCQKS